MKRRLPTNRLFYQILLYFLSLLIPIVLIGALTYAHFVTNYKRDFTENMSRSLQISADQLDAHLRTVQEAGISFFSETTVSRLLKPDSLYTLADRASLEDILQSLKRTGAILTEFAEPIFMYIDHEKVYTTSGIEDFEAFFRRVVRYDELKEAYWQEAIRRTDRVIEILEPTSITEGGGTAVERVVPVLIGKMVRGHNAVLVANIPVGELQRKLSGYAPFPTTRFVALDGYGRVVFGPEEEAGGETALLSGLAGAFPAEGPDSAELTLGDTPYIASFVQSDLYGWKLYALTPVSEFNRQASGILRMLVGICLVLMLIGLLFSFIFTFKLYTPIRRIKDALAEHRDLYEEPVRPANDFDQIGIGISQLIRHNQSFERELDLVRFEYLDQALLSLLKDGDSVHAEELHRTLRDQLGFTNGLFRCCSIHFQFKERFYEQIPDEDRIIVWSKLKKLIWGFMNEHFRVHVLEHTRHLYVCVIEPDNDNSEELLRQALESFMETFRFDLQYCIVHVGSGQVYEGVQGIAESYRESIVALQHCGGQRDCEIVSFDRLDIRPNVVYTFTEELKVLNMLKAGESSLNEKIGQYVAQQEQQLPSSHTFSVLMTDIYRTGLRFVMEQGLDLGALVPEQRHRLLNDADQWPLDVDMKKTALLEFYDRLTEELHARALAYRSNTVITAITDMIDAEYDRDLYLESISDRLSLSPKYVSRLFKEKTGMNVTQYLSQVRVERAKQLLAETDVPIGEIGEKVGIGNRTTFLRMFKKSEGMTPQSYRQAEADKRRG